MAESDPELAHRLARLYASRFIDEARLSRARIAEASEAVRIDWARTGAAGERMLRITFPFAGGDPVEVPWDGSESSAKSAIDFQASRKAEDVRWDQDNIGPTGWESSFDPQNS
jgi:hypothetical protein